MRKALLGIVVLLVGLVGALLSLQAVHASIPSGMTDLAAPMDRGSMAALVDMENGVQILRLDARGMNIALHERLHIYRSTAQLDTKTGDIIIDGFEKIAVCTNSYPCPGEIKMEWADSFVIMYHVEAVKPPIIGGNKK